MALVSIYSAGTVTVTQGSSTVTGSGTVWTSAICNGNQFSINGGVTNYTIVSRNSDTQLTLSTNYAEANASGSAYSIHGNQEVSEALPDSVKVTNVAVNKADSVLTNYWIIEAAPAASGSPIGSPIIKGA